MLKGLEAYPKTDVLRPGTKIEVRLLEIADQIRLVRFFQRLPEADRYYLKEDVKDPNVIYDWIMNMNFSRVIPMVAVVEDEIIADATLHRSRSPGLKHTGELRIAVDPAYRRRGLAKKLLTELLDIAELIGISKVVAEVVDNGEHGPIRTARSVGFTEVATLEDRVIDLWGQCQNLVLMELHTNADRGFGQPGYCPSLSASNEPAAPSELSGSIASRSNPEELLLPGVPSPSPVSVKIDEGMITLGVMGNGNAKLMMNFLNELGSLDDVRLLRVAGGLHQTTCSLALRKPLALAEVLCQLNSVAKVGIREGPDSVEGDNGLEVVLAGPQTTSLGCNQSTQQE